MSELLEFPAGWRHGQKGYGALLDLPQAAPLADSMFSTGWWEMDQLLKFYPGQFVVVTGIAGHGKSTFLLNIVVNLAKNEGIKSFLYVPENELYLIEKMRALWGPGTESFERFAGEQCFVQSAIPLDNEPHTIDWVLRHALTAVERDGVEFVVIDPWNELERTKPKDMLMTDYIGQCLMSIKDFCRTMKVTVVLVAHPTKAVNENGGRVATLADIEGSMNWFNKCDNGLVVVRDKDANTAKVISQKVREGDAGKTGVCHFMVDRKSGIFTVQHGGVTL